MLSFIKNAKDERCRWWTLSTSCHSSYVMLLTFSGATVYYLHSVLQECEQLLSLYQAICVLSVSFRRFRCYIIEIWPVKQVKCRINRITDRLTQISLNGQINVPVFERQFPPLCPQGHITCRLVTQNPTRLSYFCFAEFMLFLICTAGTKLLIYNWQRYTMNLN